MEKEDGQRILNKEQVDLLISRRLHQHRPESWEDDISRYNDDHEPFQNGPRAIELLGTQKRYGNTDLSDDELMEFAKRDVAPLPDVQDREGYGVKRDLSYWISGLNDYLKVMELIERQQLEVERMLDFGCASGRVLRHFAAQTDIGEIWGSDINARHIRWLCENLPRNVKPIANHSIPQLPIADHYFDLITSFSVFTHIDTFELCWLAELKRILKPGGIAYITVHNEDTWRQLRSDSENKNNRLIQAMIEIDPESKQKLAEEMPNGKTVYRFTNHGPYRAHVFHSNSYIENVWGRFFNVEDILPCHHARQSVVLMR